MPATYTAADALAYARELLGSHLDWIDDALAEEYGLEMIDGEGYLPPLLSEVMACLYSIQRTITDESVSVGLHMRGTDGQLYRPCTYSTGRSLYSEMLAGSEDEKVTVTRLQHPSGREPHQTTDNVPGTLRAGLCAVDGGGDCV